MVADKADRINRKEKTGETEKAQNKVDIRLILSK